MLEGIRSLKRYEQRNTANLFRRFGDIQRVLFWRPDFLTVLALKSLRSAGITSITNPCFLIAIGAKVTMLFGILRDISRRPAAKFPLVEERRITAAGSTMQCRITQAIVRPHIIRRVRQPKIATTSAFAGINGEQRRHSFYQRFWQVVDSAFIKRYAGVRTLT
ncbi:hypothetical protein A676_00511 [Salmonella enterica subsp. enterica serovar Enteritidis str. 2010K-0262]|uniref:Uncharacterized protein n=1 Tax=Salmonella enteritidis (strain 2009K0958) TaxID=1192586 RepID=A0A656IJK1_SALE2|nr:hypothetical protein A673_01128 [Salmonella enterica subsp. enterica serovar Enteritidis str. 2009K0958]EPI76922.1 hypothetical protein A672_00741 [Salmonella enterica subsp. enterica serovar Enteritidis str. 08-1080]EPI84803.1 hypothetical protein A674_03511 [Salmonella enterica subsp. enterica serovar Enteritidis str. 2009K1651]EPI90311.1 hypothetical protein A676_00511 [Salmonella enterica subsp. enterica serovar Enteritidis str. 2010K-0262]EPI91587.1 hypothetical protein A675_01054 [Salm